MKIKKNLLLFVFTVFSVLGAFSQNVALKTNLLTDIALSPNLGVEFGLAPRWSMDIVGEISAWTVNDHKWKHWFVQPEARYWFCDRFAGSFLGIHAIGGQYNFGNIKNHVKFLGSDFSQLTDYRFQGWAAGAGISYGYAWILGKHWNLEAEIGLGWIYTRYSKFQCKDCGKKIESNRPHNYFGPTKAAVNLVYIF